MNPADWIVLAIVAVLLISALLATKKRFSGKGGCCGCSGGCAGCSGSCSSGHPAPPSGNRARVFPVRGLTCDNCRKAVEQALIAVPGVTMVNVDAGTGRATVTTDGTVSDARLAEAVQAAGYAAEL